jgi:hypothetical protein
MVCCAVVLISVSQYVRVGAPNYCCPYLDKISKPSRMMHIYKGAVILTPNFGI